MTDVRNQVLSINKKLKHEVNNKTSQLLQNVRNLEILNEKLVQSEEMEREFVNTAAHELRILSKPLQVIQNLMMNYLMIFLKTER
ncbi:hypothetical protein BH23THE1_BH23THE1_33400 [soil metagenome]